jgi:diguanylate cyclase (GGDEF)-like protein
LGISGEYAMLQLILLVFIYGLMMFIWTFVFLNRSHDKVNQSFLVFLSNILIWMLLNYLNSYGDGSLVSLVAKTIYWLSMMYLAVTFLFFVYRLLKKPLDGLFFFALGLNTLTVAARYLYPIDYSDPAFWRLTTPVVAPLMSLAFSLPAVYALFLVLRQIIRTKDSRQRTQLGFILVGIGLALAVSVFSEYVLPAVFHLTNELYLMYYAIAIFVVAIFVSIMRYRLLNLRSDYIYRNLFLNASEGILIVNKSGRIMSVNNNGKQILQDEHLNAGDLVSNYLPDYRFETDYQRHGVEYAVNGQTRYLELTQYPFEEDEHGTTKLLLLTDQTLAHLRMEQEKEQLLEKTVIDSLTGMFNKQYLREKYGEETEQSAHFRSLLFIDVDDFKAINDQYGHLLGDEVLRELAACIKSTVRSVNETIRFGGDEFVVILDGTGAEDAYLVAERIRSCAGTLAFSGGGSTFHMTLSIGLMEGTEPIDAMIEKADRAMYRSKGKGKNSTTRFSESDGEGSFHMKLC